MKRLLRALVVLFAGVACATLAAVRRRRARISALTPSGDIYRLTTEDGANLALKHYRPEPGAGFNTGKQPALMMPGSVTNFNTFDIRTPEGMECRVRLPAELPDWAEGDECIERDPMKLYSMAHYLYNVGYDVWLVNYRGQGRGEEASYGPNKDIDHYGVYDVKASVEKVRELTGKRPVYVGHSMGGAMLYMYLQGARGASRWNFKVESDPALVSERNAGTGPGAVKGFVNLDGPLVPSVLGEKAVPRLLWLLCLAPTYLDVRGISQKLPEGCGGPANKMLESLWAARDLLSEDLERMVAAMYSVNPGNIDANVIEYMGRYAFDGMAAHTVAQFMSASSSGRMTEYYRNGFPGRLRVFPPPAGSGGLYCYSDNMSKVSLPSIFIVDATLDVTDPDLIRDCYDAKTRNPLDEFHLMPGTAHLDVVNGLRAPYETFPTIGAWLERLGSD
jgi:pimeloyl-ACP methyl ester carboxylesterase